MSNHTSSPKNSQSPPTPPKPAAPTYKILDDYPLAMNRPLCVVEGKGYTAVSLPISIQTTETLDKNGNILKLNPPIERVEKRFVVIREDGVIFGVNDQNPLTALDFKITLPEDPPDNKLWSPKGVREFEKGTRPDPANVFQRVVDVVDYFIDFTRSLADQQTMSELMACYVLTTWFLDAFNVIGFLWANGERGSGKTNLINIVADLSYLGQVILAGGSYASLRDMADNGATLACDDAENLTDPRKSDPDKRALLLAGNRKGVIVTLKEPDGQKGWKTRHVNAYCPRLFSAIGLPDPVLASRSIVIPLIRTTDTRRGNFDPVEHSSWPHDRRQLIDDIWALAVTHIGELKIWDKRVGRNSSLIGRALQPWRAILAVAAWLENRGVPGIWQRMEELSRKYQEERSEFEVSDFTSLVINALFECAVRAISAISANNNQNTTLEFHTANVTNDAIALAIRDDWDIDKEFITPRKTGRVLSQLRFEKAPRPGGKGSRRWKAGVSELERLSRSYNIPLPQKLAQYITNLQSSKSNGSNGTNGTNGTVTTASQTTFDDLIKSKSDQDVNQPCYACGTLEWKSFPDGSGYFCGTCHPK